MQQTYDINAGKETVYSAEEIVVIFFQQFHILIR